MSDSVRILLLIGAVCTFLYVYKGVKKSRFKAQETFFWLFLSFLFVLLGVFPVIVDWLSQTLGVASPINLVFLVVIFLLLIKVFAMDRKIARSEHQMVELVQKIAIEKLDNQKRTHSDTAEQ